MTGESDIVATDWKSRLLGRLTAREASVAVVGLGYVGLPLAVGLAHAGYRVIGIDANPSKVEALAAGDPGTPDIDPAQLLDLLGSGRFTVTAQTSALRECDAISICVPTPLRKTGDPDMSYIVDAVEEIALYLEPGAVLVLESTTYPGTTREVVAPILESAGRGLRVGHSVFLAFSPERIDPGRVDWDLLSTPKVIGGMTPDCLEVAMAYYRPAIRTLVPVSVPEAAEMAKLLENTFRAVNIGLANEALLMCDRLGLDVWEVIDAAATKPFGFMRFTPGPGLGGHCIPIDPLYLSWRLKALNYSARFIDLASEINTSMPRYWVTRIQDALNDQGQAVKGSRILLLGVAYKKNVGDVRESPAVDIAQLLVEKGGQVLWHDPYAEHFGEVERLVTRIADLNSAVRSSDCVVVVTDHDVYDFQEIGEQAQLLVDTRNAVPEKRPSQQVLAAVRAS